MWLLARGGAVGSGIALQAGRSRVRFVMVSLEFFIDLIHPAVLCPAGRPSLLTEMSKGKGKVKVHPRTSHEGPEGE